MDHMQNKLQLPSDHGTRIQQAVEASLGIRLYEPLDLMNGGYSGAFVYAIKANGNTYIVKLEDKNELESDPKRFYPNIQIAAERQIAPKVYHADPVNRILLMEHIKAQPLPTPMPDVISKFAQHIHKLHELPTFSAWKQPYDVFNYFFDKLSAEYRNSEPLAKSAEFAETICKVLTNPADERSCHADLNPNNVIFNGRQYYLIDWQASCKRSFYFDLASCAIFFYFLDEQLQDQFLDAYFQRQPTDIERAKYQLMQDFLYIYYGVLFLVLPFLSNQPLPPLSMDEIEGLPDFKEYMQFIGMGVVNLGMPVTQRQFGYVFLETARKRIATNTFTKNMEIIRKHG